VVGSYKSPTQKDHIISKFSYLSLSSLTAVGVYGVYQVPYSMHHAPCSVSDMYPVLFAIWHVACTMYNLSSSMHLIPTYHVSMYHVMYAMYHVSCVMYTYPVPVSYAMCHNPCSFRVHLLQRKIIFLNDELHSIYPTLNIHVPMTAINVSSESPPMWMRCGMRM
jgi:hypothetical protein